MFAKVTSALCRLAARRTSTQVITQSCFIGHLEWVRKLIVGGAVTVERPEVDAVMFHVCPGVTGTCSPKRRLVVARRADASTLATAAADSAQVLAGQLA